MLLLEPGRSGGGQVSNHSPAGRPGFDPSIPAAAVGYHPTAEQMACLWHPLNYTKTIAKGSKAQSLWNPRMVQKALLIMTICIVPPGLKRCPVLNY